MPGKQVRIYVDFNEMVERDLVMLSRHDMKKDAEGNEVTFHEGMPVAVYMDDEDIDGTPDNLIAEGLAVRTPPRTFAATGVNWCCRIDGKGIRHESDEI